MERVLSRITNHDIMQKESCNYLVTLALSSHNLCNNHSQIIIITKLIVVAQMMY